MANTFELIASSTVGSGGAASIDFTSIASTWTDLCLMTSLRASTADPGFFEVKISFNGSTTGFTAKQIYGDGSSATSSSPTTRQAGLLPANNVTANTFANASIYIPNYAGSANKSYSVDSVTEANQTQAYANLLAGLWSNTSAITSISLTSGTGNFVQYSTAYLYGVKNA